MRGELSTCLPCVFSLTISTSICPILSFLFSLSPILSLFSLFQQVRTLFALPVLFRVQVLRWVIDACWNLFSPHPFHCLIDESDRVQVQPRRVWEPAVDGVWCTRTGERSFSTCALQPELWWKPPIGFGHYIHTFLFPITVALLSGDRTKPVRLGWWSTQEESVTEDDLRKSQLAGFGGGWSFWSFPPTRFDAHLLLVEVVFFFFNILPIILFYYKRAKSHLRRRALGALLPQRTETISPLFCLDLNRTIGWMGTLAEAQTITGLHPFYGNLISLLSRSCDVQSFPHWLTNGVVPFWNRVEGRPVFLLACRHNTAFEHLVKFIEPNLNDSSSIVAMNWSPVTLSFCRTVAVVIREKKLTGGGEAILISSKRL